MLMKCQGKSDICQGKVREMSGNFDTSGAWEPCLPLSLIMHFETTRKQKISTLFISTFSFMCSIYRNV